MQKYTVGLLFQDSSDVKEASFTEALTPKAFCRLAKPLLHALLVLGVALRSLSRQHRVLAPADGNASCRCSKALLSNQKILCFYGVNMINHVKDKNLSCALQSA